MKKIILIALALCAHTFFSCKKSSSNNNNSYICASCVKTPEAKAEFNTSSKGIYKGILIGSSGTIKFDVANNSTSIVAILTIDGTTVNLTPSGSDWVVGQPFTSTFNGTLNGASVSIGFSVAAHGGDPTITSINIPGHPNAFITLIKESSDALVECFEGTYHTSKSEDGTFNILLSRSLKIWGGYARENRSSDVDDIDGTITNDGSMIDNSNHIAVGKLVNDKIDGTFTDRNNTTITISGKRSL